MSIRYVIDAGAAVEMANRAIECGDKMKLLAPTSFRSQVLSLLYSKVRDGEMTKDVAKSHLEFIRKMRIRILGDRVLQAKAWKIAEQLQLSDTIDAEYIALTALQADFLMASSEVLRRNVNGYVELATLEQVIQGPQQDA